MGAFHPWLCDTTGHLLQSLILSTDALNLGRSPLIASDAAWDSLSWEAQLIKLAQMAQEVWRSDRVQIWWEQAPAYDVAQLTCVADTGTPEPAFKHPELVPLAISALVPLWPETIDTFAHLLAQLEDPTQLMPLLPAGGDLSTVLMVAVQSHQGGRGLIWGERRHDPWGQADYWAGGYLGQRLARAADCHELNQLQTQLHYQTQVTQKLETELGQATQAWQESQIFIQGIVNASPCVIYVYDSLLDRVIYSNDELFQQLGYAQADLSQMPGPFLQERIHPEDQTVVCEQRRQWLEDPAPDILQIQYRVLLPTGDWRWLLIREAVFTAGTTGASQQTIGTAVDITLLKSKEIALQRANTELKRLALIDDLTQVFNRRHFERYLQAAWLNMASAQAPLSLLLCDIDNFKGYNDAYGHPAGDRCLKQVAHILYQVVGRGTDVVARYGGEEFAILLPNTDIAGGIQIAQQIQVMLKHQALPHSRGIEQRVTLSIGLATLTPTPLQGASLLVSLADQALYEAKLSGRNRYCVASPPPASSERADLPPASEGRLR
jgi:diguanylate cyclase (GGDEF)-like protein